MNEQTIFTAALDLEPALRGAFLDEACDNAELRQRVEKLLQLNQGAGKFMEQPAAEAIATLDQLPTEPPGTQIGPYKLLQQVGEGGMGVVYMAEQSEPVQRKVALKVIKPGMDTRQVIARFDAERQALAVMDHPNIAKVLDAGATESGRPYFVMELVRGIPITQYCDENNLPVRERLELFASVCQAIQHAHTKGIIHRDIKPTNVMVTRQDGQPVVKVIDFGVAKAMGQQLTEKTLFTDFAQMIGTPLYMSPEQTELNSTDIDTRSDVYSLGVLLYELLTGTTPVSKEQLKQAAFDEIRRIIREEEPPKPSTRISTAEAAPSIAAQRHTEPAKLTRLVRGELDWIVMKALEKDRNRRYETANGFGQDVQRYLADEPVHACPPSTAYRLRKFARRHYQALASAGIVALAIFIAVGALGWAVRDRAARLEAAARQAAARQAKLEDQTSHILTEIEEHFQHHRLPEAADAVKRAEWLLSNGTENDEQRQRVHLWRTDLDRVIRLEEIRLLQADAELQRDLLDPGFAEIFRHYGLEPGNLEASGTAERIRDSAISDRLVAGLHDWARWDYLQGRKGWSELLAVASQADNDPWRDKLREAVRKRDAAALEKLSEDDDLLTQPPDASLLLATALTITDQTALAVDVLRRTQQRYPDNVWINTNLAHCLLSVQPPRIDEALGFYRAAVASRPHSPGARLNLGEALWRQKKWQEAESAYREAILINSNFSAAHCGLAYALRVQNRLSESESACREALRCDPTNGTARRELVNLLSKLGRVSELEQQYREEARLRPNDSKTHFWLGALLREQHRYAEAATEFQLALRLNPGSEAYANLGDVQLAQGMLSEAEASFREAVRRNPKSPEARRQLIYGLWSRGKYAEAEAECREMIRLSPENVLAHEMLGQSLLRQDKLSAAEAAFREAIRVDPEDYSAHYCLGESLWRQRGEARYREAENAFQTVVRLKPDNKEAHYSLGLVRAFLRNWDGAISANQDALRIDPEFAAAHQALGTALQNNGQLQEAIAAFRQSLSFSSKNSSAHHALGRALQESGDVPGAIAAYRKAVELQPNSPNPNLNLALAWELATCAEVQLRDPAEAVTLAQKALDRNPTNADVLRTLGVAHYRAGDWQGAAVELEKAIQSRYGSSSTKMVSSGRVWEPEPIAELLFLAMCHWQTGQREQAQSYYRYVSARIDALSGKSEISEELRRFRQEAMELLGIKE